MNQTGAGANRHNTQPLLHRNVAGGLGAMIAAEGSFSGHVAILCAEPDMGKTTVLQQVLSGISSRGGKVRTVSLGGMDARRAASRVVSVCRQMTHYLDGDRIVALGLDDLPAMDESDVQRVSRAVRKFEVSGGNVIIAANPEAESIVDDLSHASVYRSCDLRLHWKQTAGRTHVAPEQFEGLTHGIPRLVRALMLGSADNPQDWASDPCYLSAVCDVAEHALRPGLIWEERWMRLAMLELGRGKLEDLRCVLGHVDQSLLEAVAQDVPLVGLDIAWENFSCAGLVRSDVLRAVMPRLRPVTARSLAVSRKVCALLMARGDFERASIVALACDPRERTVTVLGHAAELIDVGCRGMVEDAVSYAAEMGIADHVPDARLALASLVSPGQEYDRALKMLGAECSERATQMLLAYRGSLVNAKSASALGRKAVQASASDDMGSGMVRALQGAIAALSLMREFRFEDAYNYLMGVPERLQAPTVASCVLWAEYLLSMGLSGNAPTDADLSGFEAAIRFAGEAEVPFVHQVLLAVRPLTFALAARGDDAAAAEACAQKASAMGAPLVQELCLVAAGIADLRTDTCARAYVRFQHAFDLAQASGDAYLQAASHILLCAVRKVLGEPVTTDQVLSRRMPPRLSTVGRALAAVIEGAESVRLEVMGRTKANACPSGTAWLVHVLASDCGDLSRRFRMVVPRPWLEEARMASIVAGELGSEACGRSAGTNEAASPDDAYRMDLSVLGGFRVSVNGAPIPEQRLERRRAKCLLTLLAVQPEHSARRYEIMETVWPDLDFHDARQRVYEATSVLRGELAKRLGVRGNPLVASRGAGTLGLNPSCVHCDVDDFEQLAKSLMSNARLRPTDVVNGCARLERMYKGDVFVPLVDGAGIVDRRREELKTLCTDVMVYGSQQALALGRAETAVHFAQVACREDGLREDAELCLVKALGAAGRRLDAESSYHEFVERMARQAKRPVCQALRDAFHDLMGDDEGLALHMGQAGEARAASA